MKLFQCTVILCVVAVYGAHAAVNDTAEEVFGDGTQDTNQTQAVEQESFTGCPEGWSMYTDAGQVMCVYLSEEMVTFQDAHDKCQALGGGLATGLEGTDIMAYIQGLVVQNEGEYWTSLLKRKGYSSEYRWVYTGQPVPTKPVPDELSEFPSYKEQCVYFSSYSESLETDDCFSEYKYVCQKPIECPPGRFGSGCERSCHCLGETCDVTQGKVKCQNGCQRGWVGDACDTVRQPVWVKYYCAKQDEDSAVYIRVFTNGIEKIDVYHTTVNPYQQNFVWRQCNPRPTYWHLSGEPGVTTIRIRADTSRRSYQYNPLQDRWTHDNCNSYQRDNQMWKVHVYEKEGVVLEHDVTTDVKCNFSKSAVLSVKKEYFLNDPDIGLGQPLAPEAISEDVTLTLVDASTDKAVTTADLGTPVKLRLQYGLKPGSQLTSVIPKNCKAMSADDPKSPENIVLLNQLGCVTDRSPVPGFTVTSDHKLETNWFPLFRLRNATSMYISCGYALCFDNERCPLVECNGSTPMRFRRSPLAAEGSSSNRIQSQTVRVVQHEKPMPSA